MSSFYLLLKLAFILLFPIQCYLCVWALSLVVQQTGAAAEDGGGGGGASGGHGSYAFVQTGAELHYFRDIAHQDIYIEAAAAVGGEKSAGGERETNRKTPASSSKSMLRLFEEEQTDFGASSVGLLVRRQLYVHNPTNSNIVCSAITSSNPVNFHAGFLENKILEPQQRAGFPVFFLPTEEEAKGDLQVDALIYFHCDFGPFSHRVRGTVVDNPYRLRPLLGVRLPLNATFRTPITVHNPHSRAVRVVEVFSSDVNIHIERLPNGVTKNGGVENESREKMKKDDNDGGGSDNRFTPELLAPFETRTVARAAVLGNVERNSTTFVFIRLAEQHDVAPLGEADDLGDLGGPRGSGGAGDDELPKNGGQKGGGHQEAPLDQVAAAELVIPFQVQVLRRRSVYATRHELDFGLIQWGSPTVAPQLFAVYSNLERSVDFESIYVGKSVNQAHGIYMQFEAKPPIAVRSGARAQPGAPVPIASVFLDSTQMDATGTTPDEDDENDAPRINQRRGTIVVESRGGNYNVSVPYRARLFRGQLRHDPDEAAFHVGLKPPLVRSLLLTNRLPFGVAIWNVSLLLKFSEDVDDGTPSSSTARGSAPPPPPFHVSLVTPTVQIPQGQTRPALVVTYGRAMPAGFSATYRLHTNVTTFDVPLHVFGGQIRVHVYAHHADRLDFGMVAPGERRSARMAVTNPSPVAIRLVGLAEARPAQPQRKDDGANGNKWLPPRVRHRLELVGQQQLLLGGEMEKEMDDSHDDEYEKSIFGGGEGDDDDYEEGEEDEEDKKLDEEDEERQCEMVEDDESGDGKVAGDAETNRKSLLKNDDKSPPKPPKRRRWRKKDAGVRRDGGEWWPRLRRPPTRDDLLAGGGWTPGRDLVLPARSVTVLNYSINVPASSSPSSIKMLKNVVNLIPLENVVENTRREEVVFLLRTEFGDEHAVPVSYELLLSKGAGSVPPPPPPLMSTPRRLVLDGLFPGSIRLSTIKLHNSLAQPQRLLRLRVASGDQRFSLGPPFPLPTSQSTTPAPTLAEAISPEAAAAKGKTATQPSDHRPPPLLLEPGVVSPVARLLFRADAIGCPQQQSTSSSGGGGKHHRRKAENGTKTKKKTKNGAKPAGGGQDDQRQVLDEEDFCYAGIPLHTADGQWFAYGLKLPQNLAEIDSYLYQRLRNRWHALVDSGRQVLNTSLLVDTDRVRQFEVPIEARFQWPRLLDRPVVHFPLTAVGNFTIVNLTLSNPSSRPVIVQLLPLVIYPDAEALLELFRGEFPAPLTDPVETNETLMFSLRDTELFTLRPGSPVPQLREEVEQVVGGSVPRFTLSMLLRPGMRTRIRLGFLPSDYDLRSSLLIIRNNLTAIEPVVLYGRGAHIGIQVDNRTTRSLEQPLLFDILPSHLTECANPRRQLHRLPTTLTVRRSLPIWNSGEVPFHVVNVSISAGHHHVQPCENLGFRVLNCQPFRLDPGETIYLDVAYTPDFLMSVNDATLLLFMHMNATPWMFEMSAHIPPHLLATCHAALPRPPFERVMYASCALALVFCLICVVSCSYLEADRLIVCFFRAQFALLHPAPPPRPSKQQRKEGSTSAAAADTTRNGAAGGRDPSSSSSSKLPAVGATTGAAAASPPTVAAPPLSASARRRQRRRTNFVETTQNAGVAERWLARSANGVLWLIQPVWECWEQWVRAPVGDLFFGGGGAQPTETGDGGEHGGGGGLRRTAAQPEHQQQQTQTTVAGVRGASSQSQSHLQQQQQSVAPPAAAERRNKLRNANSVASSRQRVAAGFKEVSGISRHVDEAKPASAAAASAHLMEEAAAEYGGEEEEASVTPPDDHERRSSKSSTTTSASSSTTTTSSSRRTTTGAASSADTASPPLPPLEKMSGGGGGGKLKQKKTKKEDRRWSSFRPHQQPPLSPTTAAQTITGGTTSSDEEEDEGGEDQQQQQGHNPGDGEDEGGGKGFFSVEYHHQHRHRLGEEDEVGELLPPPLPHTPTSPTSPTCRRRRSSALAPPSPISIFVAPPTPTVKKTMMMAPHVMMTSPPTSPTTTTDHHHHDRQHPHQPLHQHLSRKMSVSKSASNKLVQKQLLPNEQPPVAAVGGSDGSGVVVADGGGGVTKQQQQRKQREALVRKMKSEALFELPPVDLTSSSRSPSPSPSRYAGAALTKKPPRWWSPLPPPQQIQLFVPAMGQVGRRRHSPGGGGGASTGPPSDDEDCRRSIAAFSETSAAPEWAADDDLPLPCTGRAELDAAMAQLAAQTRRLARLGSGGDDQQQQQDDGRSSLASSRLSLVSSSIAAPAGTIGPPAPIGSERRQQQQLQQQAAAEQLVPNVLTARKNMPDEPSSSSSAAPLTTTTTSTGHLPPETQKMIEQLTSEFQERVTRLLLDGCGTAGGAGIVTNSNQQQPQQAAALPVAVSQLLLAAAAQPPLPPHGLTTTPSFSSSSIAATEEMMAEDHRKQLVRRLLRMPADLRPGYDTAEHPTEPREGKEEDGGDEDGEQPARASSGFIASLWDTRDRVMHEQAGQQNQNPQDHHIPSLPSMAHEPPPSHDNNHLHQQQQQQHFDSLYYADDPTWRPIFGGGGGHGAGGVGDEAFGEASPSPIRRPSAPDSAPVEGVFSSPHIHHHLHHQQHHQHQQTPLQQLLLQQQQLHAAAAASSMDEVAFFDFRRWLQRASSLQQRLSSGGGGTDYYCTDYYHHHHQGQPQQQQGSQSHQQQRPQPAAAGETGSPAARRRPHLLPPPMQHPTPSVPNFGAAMAAATRLPRKGEKKREEKKKSEKND